MNYKISRKTNLSLFELIFRLIFDIYQETSHSENSEVLGVNRITWELIILVGSLIVVALLGLHWLLRSRARVRREAASKLINQLRALGPMAAYSSKDVPDGPWVGSWAGVLHGAPMLLISSPSVFGTTRYVLTKRGCGWKAIAMCSTKKVMGEDTFFRGNRKLYELAMELKARDNID